MELIERKVRELNFTVLTLKTELFEMSSLMLLGLCESKKLSHAEMAVNGLFGIVGLSVEFKLSLYFEGLVANLTLMGLPPHMHCFVGPQMSLSDEGAAAPVKMTRERSIVGLLVLSQINVYM